MQTLALLGILVANVRRVNNRALAASLAFACALATNVCADETETPIILIARRPVALPQVLTMPEALRMFREHGFDLLLSDAAAMHAEGDVDVASHVANPNFTISGGRTFNILPSQSPWAYAASLTDSNAIFDLITGKHTLRSHAAKAALEAARDHERPRPQRSK